ncbi:hypothetical protein CBR_g22375 [Chara braunii]|uniref:Uncharacterized protein n=1 Tax=Chara braunii TaxID=69332 RepID=A0A388JUV4_CHABU|nr:hypothetical protein CBR_g22375 [Chara braunii]|eukprot:GBG61578.1 hypothetical protein CBR_g22375 [Chara braunii]
MREDLNSRWEMVCEKIDQKDKVNNEVAKLREEVARMAQKNDVEKPSSSMAKTVIEEDVVERLKREQEELRAAADRWFALLEERLSALTKAKEEAEANAEVWKAEALRPGNKRGSIAVGQTHVSHARVRQRSTSSGLPTEPRVNPQIKGIVERHNMEVVLLKEMRLKDVNGDENGFREQLRRQAMAIMAGLSDVQHRQILLGGFALSPTPASHDIGNHDAPPCLSPVTPASGGQTVSLSHEIGCTTPPPHTGVMNRPEGQPPCSNSGSSSGGVQGVEQEPADEYIINRLIRDVEGGTFPGANFIVDAGDRQQRPPPTPPAGAW